MSEFTDYFEFTVSFLYKKLKIDALYRLINTIIYIFAI